MEEAASAAAEAAASVEVASTAVLAAWLLHEVAARLSDRVRLAVSGLTRSPDPEACAFGTV